jgi:ADP-heptose:LPS heptosyltransferase
MKRLVILSPNWLGDAVMALPAIADVRRSAPGLSITVAARGDRAAVRARSRGERDMIVSPAGRSDVVGWRGALADTFAGGDFDTALLLPNSMQFPPCSRLAPPFPNAWGDIERSAVPADAPSIGCLGCIRSRRISTSSTLGF